MALMLVCTVCRWTRRLLERPESKPASAGDSSTTDPSTATAAAGTSSAPLPPLPSAADKEQLQAAHARYSAAAAARARALPALFFDAKQGFFFDYNWRRGRLTPVWSLAGAFPLFVPESGAICCGNVFSSTPWLTSVTRWQGAPCRKPRLSQRSSRSGTAQRRGTRCPVMAASQSAPFRAAFCARAAS